MSILNAWLFGPPAGATLFTHPYSIEEMADQAEQVVVGEVLATRSEVRGGAPWTVATVMVESTLRGEHEILVEAAWPGGKMGDIELVVAGSPRVVTGETAVVFLGDEGRVVGLSQGVLHVEDGVAWRDLSHLGFLEGAPEGPEAYSLEELSALVQ